MRSWNNSIHPSLPSANIPRVGYIFCRVQYKIKMQSPSQEWKVNIPFLYPQQMAKPQGIVMSILRYSRRWARGPCPDAYQKHCETASHGGGRPTASPFPEMQWGTCPRSTLSTLMPPSSWAEGD